MQVIDLTSKLSPLCYLLTVPNHESWARPTINGTLKWHNHHGDIPVSGYSDSVRLDPANH